MHQRDAVAAFRFVHEMSGEEDRHPFIARKIDQVAQERIARDRIDTRGRFVEDQDLRTVEDRDGELKTLFYSQWQAFGPVVGNCRQVEPLQHFPDSSVTPVFREPEQLGMKLKILVYSQFAIRVC
jgi:hypothetical protein